MIGFAGRLIENKGVMDILHAVQELRADWQLLFVGEGECRSKIMDWAVEHASQHRVHVTGYVPLNDVARYMRAMDCFVIGTKTRIEEGYWDTFPLVVAQAMATGLPVVGSQAGGVPYQLGGSGLLFPEEDVVALREQLQRMAQDIGLRQKTSAALLKRATDCFTLSSMNRAFMDFVWRLQKGLA